MRIVLRAAQGEVFCCPERFRVLVAGRRFGKTFLALTELCKAAWGPDRTAWYVAPTYRQAKRVAWKPLKQMTKPYWVGKPNETDLTIELVSGGTISLRGADRAMTAALPIRYSWPYFPLTGSAARRPCLMYVRMVFLCRPVSTAAWPMVRLSAVGTPMLGVPVAAL